MHEYKKHLKADGSFEIKEYRKDGKERIVGEDNSGYLGFIEAGNSPEEVAYVALPTPPTPTENALSMTAFSKDDILTAIKALDVELYNSFVNTLATNPVILVWWAGVNYIKMEQQETIDALLVLDITKEQINTIKLKIAGVI